MSFYYNFKPFYLKFFKSGLHLAVSSPIFSSPCLYLFLCPCPYLFLLTGSVKQCLSHSTQTSSSVSTCTKLHQRLTCTYNMTLVDRVKLDQIGNKLFGIFRNTKHYNFLSNKLSSSFAVVLLHQ